MNRTSPRRRVNANPGVSDEMVRHSGPSGTESAFFLARTARHGNTFLSTEDLIMASPSNIDGRVGIKIPAGQAVAGEIWKAAANFGFRAQGIPTSVTLTGGGPGDEYAGLTGYAAVGMNIRGFTLSVTVAGGVDGVYIGNFFATQP